MESAVPIASKACEVTALAKGRGDSFKSTVALKPDPEGWVECWPLELVGDRDVLGGTLGTCDSQGAVGEGEAVPPYSGHSRGFSVEHNPSHSPQLVCACSQEAVGLLTTGILSEKRMGRPQDPCLRCSSQLSDCNSSLRIH